MHYQFVDIGTSNHDTSIDDYGLDVRGLLVEPVKETADDLPRNDTVQVEYSAIHERDGKKTMKVYNVSTGEYLSHDEVVKRLPDLSGKMILANGVSTFGQPLPEIERHNIPFVEREVNTLTLSTLFEKYDVTSIELLKIDTEGCEEIILGQLLKLMNFGFPPPDKIRYEYNQNKVVLDDLAEIFCDKYGYTSEYVTDMWNYDMVLTKEN